MDVYTVLYMDSFFYWQEIAAGASHRVEISKKFKISGLPAISARCEFFRPVSVRVADMV
jgi:hypothetical protein